MVEPAPNAPGLRVDGRALAVVCAALSLLPASAGGQVSRGPDIHFTPTRQVIAEAMLALAGTGPEDTVVDLGSGDGRLVVLAAQQHGARGIGVEIQAHLVALSREVAAESGVADRVRFVEGDLREADVSSATVVVLYLATTLTREITPKLRRELRPGARIVSQQFPAAGLAARSVRDGRGADLVPLDGAAAVTRRTPVRRARFAA